MNEQSVVGQRYRSSLSRLTKVLHRLSVEHREGHVQSFFISYCLLERVASFPQCHVLHAGCTFFLPYLRLKQDTVPGMTINQWFRATKTTAQARIERGNPNFNFEIACAELCGLGHTTMRGILVVDSEADFYKWLDAQYVDSTLGFDNTDQLIYRFWPATENRMEDPWGAKHWPEELKAKWPK